MRARSQKTSKPRSKYDSTNGGNVNPCMAMSVKEFEIESKIGNGSESGGECEHRLARTGVEMGAGMKVKVNIDLQNREGKRERK